MSYLLDKKLSLKAKGLLTLLLHLQEGGIQLNQDTASHYADDSSEDYNGSLRELINDGYIELCERPYYIKQVHSVR